MVVVVIMAMLVILPRPQPVMVVGDLGQADLPLTPHHPSPILAEVATHHHAPLGGLL